ncbi:DUF6262 family protein [Nonomuraea angiospora]|uniref:DUF6262 family protein n=1 Tax=Nonomuraea angiospora TaxID=46172 RepID=UPI00342A0785
MRADNSHHLVAAAKERSRSTREKATRALRRLDATGRPITIETVAHEAGISRSWLYSQPDLRTEIDKLRASSRATPALVPVRQRASDASLRSRLEAANERVRILSAENRELREQLAAVLGELRSLR